MSNRNARSRIDHFWKHTLFILRYIRAGIALWTRPPRVKGLRLDYKSVRMDIDGEPPVHVVDIEHWDSYYKRWSQERIVIDAKREIIDFGPLGTSDWLFDLEHKGSGVLGLWLLSLPVTLPLLPLLLLIDAFRKRQENKQQMSRHATAILNALKGQLPTNVEQLLIRAFKNTWKHDQEMSRRVSLTEAKAILNTCTLYWNEMTPDEGAKYFAPNGATSTLWVNVEGDAVARNYTVGHHNSPDFTIHVLGSSFVGDDARALIACYKTKEVQSF